MRIEVTANGCRLGKQTIAYAEYRLFSSLVRFSDLLRDATVSLTATDMKGGPVVCAVSLVLESGKRMRVRARGPQASVAIDRAAARVSDILRRHVEQAPPSS